MIKRGLLILFSIALLFACESGEEEVNKPKRLLEKSTFVSLMVDLHVLEAHFHRLYLRPQMYVASLDSSSRLLFDKYDVTKDEFNENLNYYSAMPDTIYTIYESALDTINQRVAKGNVINQ